MDNQEIQIAYGELISRCWDDPEFKERFVNDTKAVFVEAGIPVEENVEYKVVEAEPTDIFVVLPHVQVAETVRELTKMLLNITEAGDEIVPENGRIVIVQNTDTVRYVVLKKRPDVLSDVELDMVVGGKKGGNVNGVANVNYAVNVNAGAAVNVGAGVNFAAGVNVAVGAAFAVVAGAVVFI